MSKRKTLYPESSSSSSSQLITALSQREGLLLRLKILKTRRDLLQSTPHPGSTEELQKIVKNIADIENALRLQQEDAKNKPVYKKRSLGPVTGKLPAKWLILSPDLWTHTASFLDKASLARMVPTSKLFMNIFMEYTRALYADIFPVFDTLHPKDYLELQNVTQWRLFKEVLNDYQNFSTLVDQSYIPLFSALQNYDQESAIDLIRQKLNFDLRKNVTAMTFLQKRKNGETAITLAGRLGLQDFLDFCFNNLIVVDPDQKTVPGEKQGVIKLARLDRILDSLDNKMQAERDIKTSVEVVWMYALAHVCNQYDICKKISDKTHWNKTYGVIYDPDNRDHGVSLALIAALLGSLSLMNYVLDSIPYDDSYSLMHSPGFFEPDQLLYNSERIRATPLMVALIGNNVELVNRLLNPTTLTAIHEEEKSCYKSFLLIFDLKNRNRDRLEKDLKEVDAKTLVTTLKIYPKFLGMDKRGKMYYENQSQNEEYEYTQYTLLNLALASKWREGITLVWQAVDRLIQSGDMSPIVANVIYHENISLLNTLHAHGLSLTVRYEIPGYDFEYPLITAIREVAESYIDISIAEKIGDAEALRQINDRLEYITDTDGGNFLRLLKKTRKYLQQNPTEAAENPEGQDQFSENNQQTLLSISTGIFSTKSSGSQTTEAPDSPSNSC